MRKIAEWIEKLPISHLPYVEIGFDALHEDLICKLMSYQETIRANN